MSEAIRLLVNPLLVVSDFDSESSEPMKLCVVPSAEDSVRFAVPASYIDLLREFDGVRTVDEAIDAFLERCPKSFSKSWLQRLVTHALIPKGILVHRDQDPARVAVSSQSKRAFLHIKIPLIKPSIVDPIAHRLGFLFRREALLLGLVLFVAAHLYVYVGLIPQHHVDFNELNALGVIAIMWLSTASTIFHEFGHASAAARFGCRNTTIGWGLYFVYKVLWTNVSEAWKLPRRQRAIVDIGGVYFESMFLLLLLAAYLITGNTIFLFAFVFTDLSIATNFNPFLRMDGYWLMSDVFGIVNLRHQQAVWLQSLFARLFGNRAATVRSNLNRRAMIALGLYTVAGIGFLIYLFMVIFKVVIFNVAREYPGLLLEYWRQWQSGMSALDFLKALLEIGWRTTMLLGTGLTLFNMAKKAGRLASKLKLVKTTTQQASI